MTTGAAPKSNTELPSALIVLRMEKTLAGRDQEIARLRKENSALRRENRQMKRFVAKLRQQIERWKSVRSVLALLRKQITRLKAENSSLKRRLFGPKSEKQQPEVSEADEESSEDEPPPSEKPHRPRGQQRGAVGHGRRIQTNIAPEYIVHDLSPEERLCPRCRKPYREMSGVVETSEEIDWEVVVHRRVHQRKRYRKSCECAGVPTFITAPGPAKLVPKGVLSVGAVSHLLLEKFGMGRPVLKILNVLEISCGVKVSEGTVAGVMQKVVVLLRPLYGKIVERIQQAQRLHADETGWKVYEHIKGKASYKWWLWVFCCSDAVAFVIDPTRSKKVPSKYLGKGKGAGPPKRTLTVDMFRAYTGLEGVILSHCWSHVRRYVIEAMQGYRKALGEWGQEWVERIAEMYRLNGERVKLKVNSRKYQKAQARLCEHMQEMERVLREQMDDPGLHEKGREVLHMMAARWKELTLFIDDPEVPLDNNEAERLLRTPVVGRKNFYGSGSVWSGELAAMTFSILATAVKNGLNPLTYLRTYLQACADAGGEAPDSLDRFLPWKMSDEDVALLSAPSSRAA